MNTLSPRQGLRHLHHTKWVRIFVFASLVIGSLHSLSIAADRPNIVMIMADDCGFECIGAHGGTSYKTPILDKMAKEGALFKHCYSQPICTPSRVKLMTGIYNVRNYAEFGLLDKSQRTFGNILRDAGYRTCIVGKWQLGKDAKLPDHFGFDEHCLWQLLRRPSRFASPGLEINGEEKDYKPGYGPDVCTDYAVNFIEENKDKPFLLYYPMILTHCPFEPTPNSTDWDPDSPGSKTYKGDPKYFADMVEYMDNIVGRILNQLEKAGVRDNTLVLFTGDNGTDSPIVSKMGDVEIVGKKGHPTDGGTHVPFIAQWPGKIAEGMVSEDIVDFSDFLPTMCEAAGAPVPSSAEIDGRSFLPQLFGKKGNPRDWIYIWYARNGGRKTPHEFTRDQRYKLYRDGRFYDVQADRLEETTLNKNDLTAEQEAARKKLRQALDQYKDSRPEKFAGWVERKKAAQKKKKQQNKNKKLKLKKPAA